VSFRAERGDLLERIYANGAVWSAVVDLIVLIIVLEP
jgi:hypothetical protein